jgi:biopolymer transport protein ExbD
MSWKLLTLVVAVTLCPDAVFGEPVQPRDVQLVVTDSGQYVLAGQLVALPDLRAKLRELKSRGGPINLHVTGGPNAEYKYVMPAVQIVQEEGLGKVGILTVPATESDLTASGPSK